MRHLSVAALIISLVSSSACGLVFGGSRQVVRLDSSPNAAKIVTAPLTQDYVTPASMSLQRKQNYSVTLSADGYAPKTVELQREMRVGVVVADIIFGLVPLIVDAATGAWFHLEPSVSTVTLARTAAGKGPDEIQIVVSTKPINAHVETLTIRSNQPGVRARLNTIK